jgi:hypothetical protein
VLNGAAASIAVLLLTVGSAHATTFTIGNAQPATVFFVQGQSFTPSVQGNNGTGTPTSASGQVLLTSFTIDFLDSTSAPSSLYIYSSAPSVSNASSGTGSLATGSYAGNGVYDFTTPVSLLFNSKYFAVLPTSENIFDGSGNTYTGGIDLFPQSGIVAEGGGGAGVFDIGFNADFTVPASVPEPSGLLLFGSALSLFLLTYRLNRRRA